MLLNLLSRPVHEVLTPKGQQLRRQRLLLHGPAVLVLAASFRLDARAHVALRPAYPVRHALLRRLDLGFRPPVLRRPVQRIALRPDLPRPAEFDRAAGRHRVP